MGYKMINQCYRQYNGFPTLENINMIKNEIYKINKTDCDNDCINFVNDLNERYNKKQEENRQIDALEEVKKFSLNGK